MSARVLSHATLAGIAFMIASMQIVAANDAIAKFLTQLLPVMMVVFLRTFTQSVFLALLLAVRRQLPRRRAIFSRMQIARGALWWAASVLFFITISKYDIPGALALFFAGPLFIALTAPLFLKERFEPKLLGAALLGFAGALLIISPGTGSLQLGMLPALLGGICYASYLMATRHTTLDVTLLPEEVAFSAGMWASLLGLPLAILLWVPMDVTLWLVALAMGACSALGHVLLAMACQRVHASKLAPYAYTEMFGAVLFSYVLFATLPVAGAWLGIALVIGGGIAAALRGKQDKLDAVV